MEDGYPEDEELEFIKNFDLASNDVMELVEYVRNIWNWSDWGFKTTGKNIIKLELHTGGWSGNELIIRALKENMLFWPLYWRVHKKGGHYYFKIKKRKGK